MRVCAHVGQFDHCCQRVIQTTIGVDMTHSVLLQSLVPLMADLSRDMPERERFRRLLDTLRGLLPCDATALLRLDGDALLPVAIDGLTPDTLGRRFRLDEHPRLAALLAADGPLRFPADSPLPDPYDGLIDAVTGDLAVHDCMGCPLRVDGEPWGVLTLDALAPDRFTPEHMAALRAFGELASATVAAVARLRALARQAREEHLRAEAYRAAAHPPARQLTGQSAAFKRLSREIDLVAGSELTVLVTGETGVGKELVAQALHARSARAARPLISVNCAALPDTLVESELFGHVRGAFTGASRDRQGKFELADGGTLFLDEVGELPLAVQAKLLRVLQSGQLQRVGSDREHRVDVRLIAATNRDLAAEVRAGRLRADFYHRLSVYPLHVPPLRERGRDVLVAAGFFLEENRSRLGLGGVRLDADAQAALLGYAWPGNVRELEHLIGRSVLKALGRHVPWPRLLTLTADDLGLPVVAPTTSATPASVADAPAMDEARLPTAPASLRAAVDALQRRLIEGALAQHDGNRAAAARVLGLDRANLARLCRRLGLG